MNFELSDHGIDEATHVIEVGGEVDLYTAPELKHRLAHAIDQEKTAIVVDLTTTTFLDSTALGVLVGALKRLRAADGSLAIVASDERIVGLFECTGLDRALHVYGTRGEAIRGLWGEVGK